MAWRDWSENAIACLMIKKVLVFRTGHLGDTICAIPAFRLLRRHFGDSELILLCDQAPESSKVSAASVVRPLNIFDRIVAYPSRRGWRTFWHLFRSVREVAPDIIVILPQVRQTHSDVRIKRWFFRFCGVLDVRAAQISPNPNEVNSNEPDRLIRIVNALGIGGSKPNYDLPRDPGAWVSLLEKYPHFDLAKRLPFIVFCGGGKLDSQKWPLSRYAETMRSLRDELGTEFLALGNSQDIRDYKHQFLTQAPFVYLPTEELTVGEMTELLRIANGYLGNDTGPVHVAAAVDCAVAVIMSTRDPRGCWYPDAPNSLVIRSEKPCAACLSGKRSVANHECMIGISVDDVVGRVVPFFRQHTERATAKN